jgi:hypothetical protein
MEGTGMFAVRSSPGHIAKSRDFLFQQIHLVVVTTPSVSEADKLRG